MTIVILDDDEDTRETLSQLVDGMDATALVAARCDEAVSLVHERRPDLVIFDVDLSRRTPAPSGLDAARMVRSGAQASCNVPIIFLTGYFGDDQTVHRVALELGNAMVVAKPVEPDRLRKLIKEMVDS